MAEYTTTDLIRGRGFLEGPRWHGGRLWISDLHRHEVLSVTLDGAVTVEASLNDQPSGLGFLPDGSPLVVSLLDRVVLRITPAGLVLHSDLTGLTKGGTNDMVIDGLGRAYIGSFGYDVFGGETPVTANIVRVDPDGQAEVVADELEFPNGMVITPDGRTLIVAESHAARLTAYDIDSGGGLSNRRLFAQLEDEPDGICQDSQGGIWVSHPRGKRFVRVVEGGEVTDVVTVTSRAIACALGGDDGRTFFAATAKFWRDEKGEVVGEARVETARVAIPGTS